MKILNYIKQWLAGPELPADYFPSRTDRELIDMIRGRDVWLANQAARELRSRLGKGKALNAS